MSDSLPAPTLTLELRLVLPEPLEIKLVGDSSAASPAPAPTIDPSPIVDQIARVIYHYDIAIGKRFDAIEALLLALSDQNADKLAAKELTASVKKSTEALGTATPVPKPVS